MLHIIRYIKNTINSFILAKVLFPKEKWVYTEPHIWVAKSRLIQKVKEPKKWEKEMSQVRILTIRGSVAFFLPEVEVKGKKGEQCTDIVLDGGVVEMKNISGTRETLGGKFRLGYKQGASLLKSCRISITNKHSVFIRLLSDLSINSVKAKIAGVLKYHHDNGYFICFFEKIEELHSWTYKELRSIIGKKI